MVEEVKYLQDDYIYPLDLEEELDYVMQVEEIVGGSFESHRETYFIISDYDFEFEGHEEIHQDYMKVI